MAHNYIFTSESVSSGHPDKVSDQISDAILDAFLAKDPNARVAIETMVSTGFVVIAGEVTSEAYVEIKKRAREVIKEIGYTSDVGFDGDTCGVLVSIDEQSTDISNGIKVAARDENLGAGDQGIMFGYATDETDALMPMPIYYAHLLLEKLEQLRKSGVVDYLRPDSKSQVSVYYEDDQPKYIDSVLISTQHNESATQEMLQQLLVDEVIKKVIPAELMNDKTRFIINPSGRFVIGGPVADAGLTGRKIIVDTYGGMGRHGGGAFSGKDPSKVDRSAAYMARYIVKNLVAAKLAKRAELQLSYAIGLAEPVSVMVNSFGTGALSDEKLAEIVQKEFDLRPYAIIKELDLLRPIYLKTAVYGHFGRNLPEFTWERTDRVNDLSKYL